MTQPRSGSIRTVRSAIAGGIALLLAVAAVPASASAATSATIDFTASGYSTGALKPAGQNGWWQAKVADYSLVDNSSFPASGLPSSGRSLQFSNASIPSGGAHLVGPTIDAAGEPATTAPFNTFETEFTVASATGALQTGLGVDVAIDGASRYGGVVNLRHTAAGLEIGSYWVPEDAADASLGSWRSDVFATVDATVPHTIGIKAVFLEGQADSVQVFVDGTLVSDGSGVTTWEFYHVIAGTGGDKSVDGLSFKSTASGPSADGIGYTSGIPALPSAAGQGFLFTGISFASSTGAPPLPTETPELPAEPDPSPDAELEVPDGNVTGDTIDVRAEGFLPYENVFVTFFPGGVFGGWLQADANGVVEATVEIPAGLTSGTTTIQLTGEVTGWTASAEFTLVVPAAAPGSPAPAGVLPTTGLETGWLIPMGAALLLAGALLAAGVRMRRS